jgi:hypothetical protein
VVAVDGVAMLAMAEVEVVEVRHDAVTTLGCVDVHMARMREVERGRRDGSVVNVVEVEVVQVPIVEVVQVAFVGHGRMSAPAIVDMLVHAVRPMLERVHAPIRPGSPRRHAAPPIRGRTRGDVLIVITSRHGTTAPARG